MGMAQRAATLVNEHKSLIIDIFALYEKETGVDAADDMDSDFMAFIHHAEESKEWKLKE